MSWQEIAKEFGVHPADVKSILETTPNSLPRRMAEEIKKLREALEWYADKKNWIFKRIKTPSGGVIERLGDRGKIARKALEQSPKEES